MSNSFYYFFSAVPQVLGGILALFGVFVIFKIQTIKSELTGIGKAILAESDMMIRISTIKFSKKVSNPEVVASIKSKIDRNDFKGLRLILELIEYKDYAESIGRYQIVYDFLQSLISTSIYFSIFTSFIIILCLTIIPFGCLILSHANLLYSVYAFVIVSIGLCLSGLSYILIKTLKD